MSASVPKAGRNDSKKCQRVLVLGATGTAGRATTEALIRAGHNVTCLVRKSAIQPNNHTAGQRPEKGTNANGSNVAADNASATTSSNTATQSTDLQQLLNLPAGTQLRTGDVTDPESIQRDGICGEHFDALVSCLASRNGAPADAWEIDYKAHVNALSAAKQAGIKHMVLLSAICVQRPRLIFQQAKLAFEKELMASGITYSIVRPTAFFKSLSGQVERVKKGKPFLLFGDGTLTACKPISDNDLGEYIAECLTQPARHNLILPIGGPGNAITPRQQGERLFAMTGKKPRFVKIPLSLINSIRIVLETGGKISSTIADKAEFARIAHYYATESMLVLNHETGQYDADATPSTGTETLFDFYEQVLDGKSAVERGEHAIFQD